MAPTPRPADRSILSRGRRLGLRLCVGSVALWLGATVASAQGRPPTPTPPPAAPAASVAVDLTVTPTTITLNAEAPSASRDVEVTAKLEPSAVAAPVSVSAAEDLPNGLTVVARPVGAPLLDRDAAGVPTGDSRQRVRLTFSQIPRRLEAVSVPLEVGFGKLVRTVPLTVSNSSAPPAGAALQLQVSGDQRWGPDAPIAVTLIAKGAALPQITVAAGPFSDAARKRSAPLALCLAREAKGPCIGEVSLAENEALPVFLISKSKASLAPGVYVGTVRLISANGVQAEQALSLEVSSPLWTFLGVAVLAAGLVLSFVTTILWPHLHARWLALQPFSLLAGRLDAAKRKRSTLATPKLDDRATDMRSQMQPDWLVGQRWLASPIPDFDGSLPDPAPLKAHLDALNLAVGAVEHLTKAMVAHAGDVGALDAMAAEDRDFPPADLQAAINQALGGTARLGAPEPLPTPGMIVAREGTWNIWLWIVTAAVTAVAGYVLLIGLNPAFGGVVDLITVFFWAFGLSASGGKLGDLTVVSVRKTLRPPPIP